MRRHRIGSWASCAFALMVLGEMQLAVPACAQSTERPAISVAAVVVAEPASETPLPIQVGPPSSVPRNSFLRVRGLPSAVALTEGHSVGPGTWAVPLQSLAGLRLAAPVGSAGKSEIIFTLMAIDGTQLAEAKSVLILTEASALVQGKTDLTPAQPRNLAALGPAIGPAGEPSISSGRPPRNTAPVSPSLPAEAREKAVRHTQKGDEQLAVGDIAAARLFYQKAADLGWGAGALALAATYDPAALARLKVRGVQADLAMARRWYEKARELGASEAEERLRQLGSR